MRVSQRLLLRGLRQYIPEGSTVEAIESGKSDALGPVHKVTAVLTSDTLLLATPVRAKTILTEIPRADIRSVDVVEPGLAAVSFDDYTHAVRRVVQLDLRRHGDREAIIGRLEATEPGEDPSPI